MRKQELSHELQEKKRGRNGSTPVCRDFGSSLLEKEHSFRVFFVCLANGDKRNEDKPSTQHRRAD